MSYCDCDYDYDYVQPEFFTWNVVKRSRKEHVCCECGGPIFIGEAYEKQSCKFEGEMVVHKECVACMEIRDWAVISMPCFCAYEWGSLLDRVREMVADVEKEVDGFRDEWDLRRYQLKLRKMTR